MTLSPIPAYRPHLPNARLWRALAGWLLAIILTGCSHGAICDEPEEPAVKEGYELYFKLRLAKASRATDDDYHWENFRPSEEGDEFENRIDLNSIRIHIYSVDGTTPTFIRSVIPEMTPGDSLEDYVFKINLEDISYPIYERKLRVMMTANCAMDDISKSSDLTYNYKDLPEKGIPFFGVTTIDFPFYGENPVNIDLLRACAKIEIEMSGDLIDEGYYIRPGSSCNGGTNASAKFTEYGYVLPNGWNTASSTGKMLHSGSLREYGTSRSTLDAFSTKDINSNQYSKIWIYLPEVKNGTDRNERYITLNYYNPTGRTNNQRNASVTLYFRNYSEGSSVEGTQYDIVRNHIYRYTIAGIATTPTILYAVSQWDERISGDINFH